MPSQRVKANGTRRASSRSSSSSPHCKISKSVTSDNTQEQDSDVYVVSNAKPKATKDEQPQQQGVGGGSRLATKDWLPFYAKYKATWGGSFLDSATHFAIYAAAHYALWTKRDSLAISSFLVILIALLDIKTATISHDCGHNSYTSNSTFNYFYGIFTAVFIFFPYSWNYRHNTHHMTNGNVENKYQYNFNELIQYTMSDYEAMTPRQRLMTSTLLSPLVLFAGLVPLNCFLFERFSVIFLILNRNRYHTLPSNFWLIFEQITGNVGVAAMMYLSWHYDVLWHILLVKYVFFVFSGLLFVNQHTFNPPYVVSNKEWNLRDSGLHGSSFILIPWFLKYFTGSIEYHHIHHMNSKTPGYNLQKIHEEVLIRSPHEFDEVVQLNMSECWNNLWLSLYDDKTNKYISFKNADLQLQRKTKKKNI